MTSISTYTYPKVCIRECTGCTSFDGPADTVVSRVNADLFGAADAVVKYVLRATIGASIGQLPSYSPSCNFWCRRSPSEALADE